MILSFCYKVPLESVPIREFMVKIENGSLNSPK
nr:MAG TPA: hypothetical protein [Caudoviricetes sp.]DAX96849.1 MAG TPA: hypothetical protein [Bacteriophage sp.]